MHCVPDQHPGVERGSGSGRAPVSRAVASPWLPVKCARWRSVRRLLRRDQGADDASWPRSVPERSWCTARGAHAGHRRSGRSGQRDHGRDLGRVARTIAGIEQVNQTVVQMDETTSRTPRWWRKPVPPRVRWRSRPSSWRWRVRASACRPSRRPWHAARPDRANEDARRGPGVGCILAAHPCAGLMA